MEQPVVFPPSRKRPEPRALFAFVHIALPALLSALALAGCLFRIWSFAVDDYDYGIFTSLLWNFAHGNGWRVAIYEGSIRVNFLADHLALLVPLLSPVFRWFPSPYTLSVLHGFAFTAVFFLVPVFVREVWREAGRQDYLYPALFLLLALSVFRGFNGAWMFQSHMTTLAMPFLLGALIALHRKAVFWVCIWSLLLAMAQERAAVAVFGIGMYAWLITGNPRLGLGLCACSAAWFLASVKLVIPSFYPSDGSYMYTTLIQPFHDLGKKIKFSLHFLLFWFFLPCAGKRAFAAALCSLPLLGLSFITSRDTMYGFGHQYQDLPSIFMLAAATHGLLWLTRQGRFQRLPAYIVCALAALCIAGSANWGKKHIPLRVVSTMRFSEADARLNEDIKAYSQVDPNITVYATGGIGPRLSLRKLRRSLSLETAAREFQASMVFVAPKKSLYPMKAAEPLLAALDANPSLRKIQETAGLVVYASKDLPITGQP